MLHIIQPFCGDLQLSSWLSAQGPSLQNRLHSQEPHRYGRLGLWSMLSLPCCHQPFIFFPSPCFLQCWQLLTCSLLSATDWKMSSHQSLSFKHFQSACQVLAMVVGVQMCRGMSHGSSTPYTSLVCSYYMSLIRQEMCTEVGNLDSSA